MFLGRYDYTGDPTALRQAYDAFVRDIPGESLPFHSCVAGDDGLTILDCCPSREVFEAFSTDDAVLSAMRSAGLPAPVVTPVGDVHVARTGDRFVFPPPTPTGSDT